MKEIIKGVKKKAEQLGIKTTTKEQDLIEANRLIGEIRGLEEQSNKLYREERLKFSERLSLSHTISNLRLKQEQLWGLTRLKTHKEIDKELGIK